MLNPQWWNSFVNAWNRSRHASSLAGLGEIQLIVEDDTETQSEVLSFDQNGQVMISKSPVCDGTPTLTSSSREWMNFLMGNFTATEGVLKRYIRYKGSLSRILPYSTAFNRIGELAREANLIHVMRGVEYERKDD